MKRSAERHPAERRPARIAPVRGIFRTLGWLLVAMAFSVVAEWVGLTFFWSHEGARHSERMLHQEIQYLNHDFKRSLIVSRPAQFAHSVGRGFYRVLFEWTRVVDGVRWLERPVSASSSSIKAWLRSMYRPLAVYVQAAMNAIAVFGVRIAVLTLAMPAFVLFGLAALTDGLVKRDLRRWGGGRESAFMYHHAKRLIFPSLLGAWVIYLAMPVSIHPNLVILPFVLMFSIVIAIAGEKFKKYL